MRQLFAANDSGAPVLRTRSYSLRRYRDGVYLAPARDWTPPAPHSIMPGQVIELSEVGRISLSAKNDSRAAAVSGPVELVIDFRRGGERCHPAGRSHSVSLKPWPQESGVPPWWRDRIPLLVNAGQIVCIGDVWECISASQEPGDRGWKLQWERNSIAGSD